jgi:hypothetical protein
MRLWVFGKKSDPMKSKEREMSLGVRRDVCVEEINGERERERTFFCFGFFFLLGSALCFNFWFVDLCTL